MKPATLLDAYRASIAETNAREDAVERLLSQMRRVTSQISESGVGDRSDKDMMAEQVADLDEAVRELAGAAERQLEEYAQMCELIDFVDDPMQRAALSCRYVDGMSIGMCAHELGMPKTSAARLLEQADAALERQMALHHAEI